MLLTLSLLTVHKAPLNTTIDFLGWESMMGPARGYVLAMYFFNICALQLICLVAAKGQTDFGEVVMGSIVIQFCEFLVSETTAKFLGVFSILPIFGVTVLVLAKLCGLSLRSGIRVGIIYYTYHVVSLLLIILLANSMK